MIARAAGYHVKAHVAKCKSTVPSRINSASLRCAIRTASVKTPLSLHPEIGKVLFSPEVIDETVQRLGREIGEDHRGKDVVILGVLKGAFMFTADLVRHIQPFPKSLEVEFIRASSYGNSTESSGTVKMDAGFDLSSLKGKHVLLVEDIIDSGLTLTRLSAVLREYEPASVNIVALLDKKERRKVTIEADYKGFECPDEFVVGYGIDYAERFRYLPYVGVPKPECI